jgi:hypothetical protein
MLRRTLLKRTALLAALARYRRRAVGAPPIRRAARPSSGTRSIGSRVSSRYAGRSAASASFRSQSDHHFRLYETGGAIEVGVKDPADRAVLDQIRTHLKAIATDFSRGDFGKPFATHGEVPPRLSMIFCGIRFGSMGRATRYRSGNSVKPGSSPERFVVETSLRRFRFTQTAAPCDLPGGWRTYGIGWFIGMSAWPCIGCDMRIFHMRPIEPAGGRRRKNRWNETGWPPYAGRNASGGR